MVKSLKSVQSSGYFSDVTLVANDGQSYQGHRLVLSAESSVLLDLFKSAQSYEPVVCVLDIKSAVLQSLMDYIYLGEAQINQININEFKEALTELRIQEDESEQSEEEDIYMTMGRGREMMSGAENHRKSKPNNEDLLSQGPRKKIKIGRYQNSFKDFSIYQCYFKQQQEKGQTIPEDLPVKKFHCVDCSFATRFEEILRRHRLRHQIENLKSRGLNISRRNLSLPSSFCY